MKKIRENPRLIYLVDALDHPYQSGITRGIVKGAAENNTDLYIVPGGRMVLLNGHLHQRKFVYDLVEPRDFDGVVLLGTSISSQEGHAAIAPLIIRFASLPLVSIGLDVGMGSALVVDNKEGMMKMAEHLLDAHSYKRFAYISGPMNNKEARQRLKAFKSVLESRHLHLPEASVVEGAFTEASGETAIRELMDERHIDVTQLDAIVAANDSMAVGAMVELKQRGIRVPQDVAMVGFDDIEAARYADAPLTTIQQPLLLLGRRAVERVLSLLGTSSAATITVSPKLVVRRSCGCGTDVMSLSLSTSPPTDPVESLDTLIAQKRQRIEYDLGSVAERGGVHRGWEKDLMDAVVDVLNGSEYSELVGIITDLVQKSIETGEGVHVWATVLATLEKRLNRLISPKTEERKRVEVLMHRARLAMSEALEQFHAAKVRMLRHQTAVFNEAAIAMLTTLDVNALREAAVTHLPKLGIDTYSIALFDNLKPRETMVNPFLIMNDGTVLSDTKAFDRSKLVSPEILDKSPCAFVIEPLCYYNDAYGVAALSYGPSDAGVYEQVGAFISAGIKALIVTEARIESAPESASAVDVHIDSLTRIYNGNHLTYRLEEELARAQELNQPLSVVLLDMDDFKELNRELGAKTGDRALVAIAETIKKCVKPTEIVARLEEDTFAVLFPNTTSEEVGTKAALIQRRMKLALAFEFHGHIAASFGLVTTTPPHDIDVETLMRSLKRALTASKESGKDCLTHAEALSD